MIHWKLSLLSIALGSAATLGFVWLARSSRGRSSALPAPALDEAARADALRDLEAGGDDSLELDFVEPMDAVPVEIRSLDEESLARDEHYDAVDPEDLGTEWLSRATEAPPNPHDVDLLQATEDGDVAQEIPVGTTDPQGNTELHPEERPSREPVVLPPNEEELARRLAAESDEGSVKPNG